jgi:hypothetical protein
MGPTFVALRRMGPAFTALRTDRAICPATFPSREESKLIIQVIPIGVHLVHFSLLSISFTLKFIFEKASHFLPGFISEEPLRLVVLCYEA